MRVGRTEHGGREGETRGGNLGNRETMEDAGVLALGAATGPREYGLGAPGVDDCVRKATRACDIIHIAGRR